MRRRLRSVSKWGGAVVTVLVLLIWIGSAGREWEVLSCPPYGASVMSGRLYVFKNDRDARMSSFIRKWFPNRLRDTRFRLWFEVHNETMVNGPTDAGIWIPIWSLSMISGAAALLVWKRDRRRHAPGLCVNCGYDLRGADRPVCPECGAAAPLIEV